jgi:flagella basal body P-ring formation protein FlgA
MSLALILAAAAAFADLDAIDRQVALFTGAQVGMAGGLVQPLDRRLQLRPCFAPLALSWRGDARDTVVAQCPDAGGWRLFVPVRAAALTASGPPAVSRGDAVTMAISGEGFSVSQPAEALDAGSVGAWVRVRAVGGKGEPMRAQVIRPGLVTVPMP